VKLTFIILYQTKQTGWQLYCLKNPPSNILGRMLSK